MLIDFDKIEETVTPQFKGGEGETHSKAVSDGQNKIMHGCLPPGSSIGLHRHETNSEIIYILSGQALCLYDDSQEHLVPGQCHYCPKGHSHSLVNASSTQPLVYFAVIPEQ